MRNILFAILIFVMTFSGTLGAYFLKRTIGKLEGKNYCRIITIFDAYLGGMFYVLGAVMNIILLHVMDYTVVYPMTSLTYVWTLIFSYFVLNEKINMSKVVSIVLIVTGVVVIAL